MLPLGFSEADELFKGDVMGYYSCSNEETLKERAACSTAKENWDFSKEQIEEIYDYNNGAIYLGSPFEFGVNMVWPEEW
ncbi:hypothetical protein [Roseovarius sp. E0-M6]|uniref:hypothetical protein n=1 Tax=Roseovarius sp. E0-M6 TaxID=3127118 RepID=UPI00300FA08B